MYHFLSLVLEPSFLLYLLLGVVIGALWWKRKDLRRRLLWLVVPYLLLTILCIPAVSFVALRPLEWYYPPLEERPDDVELIVVLGGYITLPDPGSRGHHLGIDTHARCARALELYHQGKPCRVLVSGGMVEKDDSVPPIAEVMREYLVQHGVKPEDILVEGTSRTTYENAVECSRIIESNRIRNVVLVTDAAHLYRSLGCFRKRGIDAVPCGCRYRTTRFEATLGNFLPNPAATGRFQAVWHEWLGILWYKMHGRL
jgi:uncharacterized SAM-binding protein YcdF (DUF218 family)